MRPDDRGDGHTGGSTLRVLLAGPHGGFNLGDEFILSEIIRAISGGHHEISVLSQDQQYAGDAHGVPALPWVSLRHRNIRALRRLRDFDVVVVAGGEQLQEARFGNPFWGLLANVWITVQAARIAKNGVMLYAVGAETLATPVAEWILRSVLRNCDAITARDEFTRGYLQRHTNNPVHLVADPVFSAEKVDRPVSRKQLESRLGRTFGELILLCPANDKRNDLSYVEPMIRGAREAAVARRAHVLVLAMEHQPGYDNAVLENPLFGDREFFTILPKMVFNRAELSGIFAAADVVLSARMHPLIIASTQGTPWVSINRNKKLKNFCDVFGVEGMDPSRLSADTVYGEICSRLASSREDWRDTVLKPVWQRLVERSLLAREVFDETFVHQVQNGQELE